MAALPDFEGMAIFAKVVEARSFARAAVELKISKATVSKAVSRLETRLGARLFHRTSRKLAITEAGRKLAVHAVAILAEAESAESEVLSQAASPRGLIRLAVPMSFGVLYVAPLLPAFFKANPEISIDLHLSDALVDIVGDGFDAAIRIAALEDSSLVARRLCDMRVHLVASPSYLKAHGRPKHPKDLSEHVGLSYAHQRTQNAWRFTKKSVSAVTVRWEGPLRVNNGEAMLPSLIAGIGIGVLPDFIVGDALKAGKLESLLPDWSLPSGAVYWVTPPMGLKPKRLEVLADYLAAKLGAMGPSKR